MERLREQRLKHGFTLEFVAKKLGLKNQYVSNYELGKRSPDYYILSKFADFYNVSADYLIEHTDDPTPYSSASDGGAVLSADELALIEKYRRLSEKSKGHVEGTINTLFTVENNN